VQCVTVNGVMYYPSYVVSKTAIHGYKSVPTYPASHGCIRVPMWMAKDLWYDTPTGMTIDVYYNK
jgi:lipoprotein-anchoring transpeptidase ErfK/SrfK